ncbi:uncharacterized protein LOC110826561 [Zootermopsis nevadensis]|nr:uncharacterized protein LOC110826561 [Zootermopsis nevadensis]
MAVLPVTVPLDGDFARLESHSKEDFQKMLAEWQEHLGSMEVSDTEDMDVKNIVGPCVGMPQNISEHLPDDIFEEDTKSSISSGNQSSPLKLEQKSAFTSVPVKDESDKISLDSFIKCEEGDDGLGLAVTEDDMAIASAETALSGIKFELDDDCIDVETVSEQIPVLEAGDLTSLLEQFEASEAFNSNSNSKPSVLDTHLYAMATQQLTPSTPKDFHVTPTPTKGNTSILSHQNIKDSLPKEVIDRIKASGRKKVIPLIPAMPSKRSGRGGTRMQDAGAALSRNKLLKIVSGGGGGESVQLDHDYCTVSTNNMEVAPPPHSFYHSDASDYVADKMNIRHVNDEDTVRSNVKSCDEEKVYSRLPEYYMVLAPHRLVEKNGTRGRKVAVRDDECWGESNSKKDSGLESGEVSDASEDTAASPSDTVQRCNNNNNNSNNNNIKCLSQDQTGRKSVTLKEAAAKTSLLASSGKNCSNVLSVNGRDYHIASSNVSGSKLASSNAETVCLKPGKEMTMISVLKKCQIANVPSSSDKHVLMQSDVGGGQSSAVSEVTAVKDQQGPKKRKLNLQEYRSRIKELDQIRGSRENSCASSPVPSPSCSASVVGGASIAEDADSALQDGSCGASTVSAKPDACSGGSSAAKDAGPVTCETAVRPMMQSVEVQTVSDGEVPVGSETRKHTQKEDKKERRGSHSRDRRRRQYRSRRASSLSSSGSSSSGNSRRHHTRSRSRHRRSWRHSPAGWSNGSSGSRSRGIWSRSPSSGSAKSCSSYSSRSRSRSRSSGAKPSRRSPSGSSKRWRRLPQYDQYGRDRRKSDRNYAVSRRWRRSRSPQHGNWNNMAEDWQLNEREKQRQVEERRVIYVGRIEEGTSKAELRRRFEVFGRILDISVHFREHGDNYGFVTFAYKMDAYEAVEHGNDDPNQPRYDLCFGGRRVFCKTRYSDLDGMATRSEPLSGLNGDVRGAPAVISSGRSQSENSFDLLLREAQAKLHKRKA